ncbi:MAG: glycosyltransferase family 39 protein [Gemmatimonadetes bacterium]|nr:glycosyltransferase family 39 protein [Gemmatimonadota bacterium]
MSAGAIEALGAIAPRPVAAYARPRSRVMAGARRPRLWLLSILLVSISATVAATLRTSTTFDELIMMAGGARGWETGRFDIQPEHPPLMLYLYGLPVHLSGPAYPPHADAPQWRDENGRAVMRDFNFRYAYSRAFLWGSGNDPVRIAFLARLVAALCAAGIVVLTFAFARRAAGSVAAVTAAALIAFLPDMLAHGGVAYNDVPLALGWFASLWAADRAIREPTVARGALFGLCAALALSVKFSAVVIAPAALLILLAEAVARGRNPVWWRRAGLAALAAGVTTYGVLVAVYRGDPLLGEFFYGLDYTFGHVNRGHGAPAFLLGEMSYTGWWYFYPVAFLYKSPVAFQVLLVMAILGFLRVSRRDHGSVQKFTTEGTEDTEERITAGATDERIASDVTDERIANRGGDARGTGEGEARGVSGWRRLLCSPLRMPVLGAAMFMVALLSSNLAIGFRYALPVLPLLCVLIGAGLAGLWARSGRGLRGAMVALVLWHAASALSFYPHFLAYTSEYGHGRDLGHNVLLDSSLDWGQGLLEVRDWMRDQGVDRIYLSYFGSGMPSGYGIDYVPLPSFFPLPQAPSSSTVEPGWIVVSATNLHGVYLPGDPMARIREFEPDTVLGHTMMVYRMPEQ